MCDDPDAVDELFDRIESEIGRSDAVLLWKVSCGMRRPALEHNRNRVKNSIAVSGVITCNTVPNCLAYRPDGSTAIKTANGITRGGMAGPAIHAIALDHAAFMTEELHLSDNKIVIGAGGADDTKTVCNFIRTGASLVQTQSAFREMGESPDFIRDVNLDLVEEFKGVPLS